MKAEDIYYKMRAIADVHYAYTDQLEAIAKWIESEFDYRPKQKKSIKGEKIEVKLYNPELNKPNPSLDDITFSEDVFIISESGVHGLAYFDFEEDEWNFHTERVDNVPFKWYYPIVKSFTN